MKRILILLVLVLLLGGGAAAGAYFFMPALLGLKHEQAAAPPPPEKPVSVKPVTVRMTTLDVPVVIDGAIDRQVHFTVVLVVSPETLAKVQADLPRLRNAIIQFCYAAFPKQYAEHHRMDLPRLKASLSQIAERVLGPGRVKDVLLQSYLEM
ncbi:hypothetical protein [Oleispirillum naphthae]|uniref:hypothetical protein n=1 Tax=Oleispirillum naphthae TaxID=2838853 RepID=UPI0030823F1A